MSIITWSVSNRLDPVWDNKRRCKHFLLSRHFRVTLFVLNAVRMRIFFSPFLIQPTSSHFFPFPPPRPSPPGLVKHLFLLIRYTFAKDEGKWTAGMKESEGTEKRKFQNFQKITFKFLEKFQTWETKLIKNLGTDQRLVTAFQELIISSQTKCSFLENFQKKKKRGMKVKRIFGKEEEKKKFYELKNVE